MPQPASSLFELPYEEYMVARWNQLHPVTHKFLNTHLPEVRAFIGAVWTQQYYLYLIHRQEAVNANL